MKSPVTDLELDGPNAAEGKQRFVLAKNRALSRVPKDRPCGAANGQ